jgi:hypothetical protein
MKEYKVSRLIDDTYQVLKMGYVDIYAPDLEFLELDNPEVVFQGSISDCNAWLQLNDKNYL